MDSITQFLEPAAREVGLFTALINFFCCLAMAFLLRWFYVRRSSSMVGKLHIGTILPILSAVVFLVIMVVKSSLALSLGLVGALSVVRFRTPIKEPEELVYLFLAIGIGLGYGAGQTAVTTVIVLLLLIVIYLWLSPQGHRVVAEYQLLVHGDAGGLDIAGIRSALAPHVLELNVIRAEAMAGSSTLVLALTPNADADIGQVLQAVKDTGDGIECTLYQTQNA